MSEALIPLTVFVLMCFFGVSLLSGGINPMQWFFLGLWRLWQARMMWRAAWAWMGRQWHDIWSSPSGGVDNSPLFEHAAERRRVRESATPARPAHQQRTREESNALMEQLRASVHDLQKLNEQNEDARNVRDEEEI